MKAKAKLFVLRKENKWQGEIALTVIYTHLELNIMRKEMQV